MSTHMSIHMPKHMFAHMSMHMSIRMFICMSIRQVQDVERQLDAMRQARRIDEDRWQKRLAFDDAASIEPHNKPQLIYRSEPTVYCTEPTVVVERVVERAAAPKRETVDRAVGIDGDAIGPPPTLDSRDAMPEIVDVGFLDLRGVLNDMQAAIRTGDDLRAGLAHLDDLANELGIHSPALAARLSAHAAQARRALDGSVLAKLRDAAVEVLRCEARLKQLRYATKP